MKTYNFYFFPTKPIILKSKPARWRNQAKLINLSLPGRLRLEWMIYYYTSAKENASLTARHFGISRRIFYKWLNRFKEGGQRIRDLEDQSKAPHKVREWEISLSEEARIKALRQRFIHYGKKKLRVLYQKIYQEKISTWKIERVIRKHQLYPNPKKAEKIVRKQKRARLQPKKRITELTKLPILWFLLQLEPLLSTGMV